MKTLEKTWKLGGPHQTNVFIGEDLQIFIPFNEKTLDFSEAQEIARLIVSVPELLEAAKIGLSYIESEFTGSGGKDLTGGEISKIKSIIDKAEGGK